MPRNTTTTADDAWADPAWQVDSTLLACCGNIGHRHAPGCSAGARPSTGDDTPSFPPPAGAQEVSEWVDLEHGADGYRSIIGAHHIYDRDTYVQTTVVQNVDGGLEEACVRAQTDPWLNIDLPECHPDNELPPAAARRIAESYRQSAQRILALAAAFEAAADLAEKWGAGR